MNFSALKSSIVVGVTLSVMGIVALSILFGVTVFDEVTSKVEDQKKELEVISNENNYYIKIIDLKSKLNRVIKDVNYSSFLTHANILRVEGGGTTYIDQREKKRKDIWDKGVQPVLDSIDVHMDDGYSDDVRANFNKVNDKVIEVFNLQQKIVRDFKRSGFAKTKDIDQLNKLTIILSESYNSFLNESGETDSLQMSAIKMVNEDSVFVITIFFVVLSGIIIVITTLISFLRKPIVALENYIQELRNGNFPDDLQLSYFDYEPMARSLNFITKRLKQIYDYATQVGKGDFEITESLKFERDGEFGSSLAEMQENLLQVAEKDRQRDHINRGLATFSDILSSYTNNLEQFSEEVTKNLVKFLNANQGAMFIVEENEEGKKCLELEACYAYDKKKYLNKQIKHGQGLIGQAWIEKKRIYMTEIPNQYTTITSGLGYSTPKCILIIPLVFNEEVHGVLELASFNVLQDYELDFVDEVSESISSSLASVKINSQTQMLLNQSEHLTDQMIKQEEEMRKKVDELANIQNEAQLREEKYIREIRRLEKRIKTYERHL